jgi:calcineurin-like phosphoesterase family protein
MNTWLISDTHFGHENILKFQKKDGTLLRNFESIYDMNEVIVRNWNSKVKPEDKVYHLGDVNFCSFTILKEIFNRLNGTKVLIKGNHDNYLKISQLQQLFKDIRAYHVLDNILLAHIPIHPLSLERWKGQVHGHLHDLTVPDLRYFNVSVERINYTPINFNEIRNYFEALRSTKE